MSVDDVINRAKYPSRVSIRDILEPNRAAEAAPADELPGDERREPYSPLPSPGDDYKAYAMVSNKQEVTLRLILDGGVMHGPSYVNLDSVDWELEEKAGGEPTIVMLFMTAIPREVIISGRNLVQLYDYLSDHRIRWIRQIPKGRDFAAADQPVVTGIAFRKPIVKL